MLIEYSNFFRRPVFDIESKQKVAEINGFLIDEKDKKIEVFVAKTNGMFPKNVFIPQNEIIETLKDGLIIKDTESLVSPSEMVRFEKKLKKRPKIIEQKVFTRNGEYLGKVSDFVFENTSCIITRLYIKKLFDQRIIHASAILKIEEKKIIVKDNFEMVKPELMPINTKTEPA